MLEEFASRKRGRANPELVEDIRVMDCDGQEGLFVLMGSARMRCASVSKVDSVVTVVGAVWLEQGGVPTLKLDGRYARVSIFSEEIEFAEDGFYDVQTLVDIETKRQRDESVGRVNLLAIVYKLGETEEVVSFGEEVPRRNLAVAFPRKDDFLAMEVTVWGNFVDSGALVEGEPVVLRKC